MVVILPLPLKNRLKYSRKTAGNKKAPGGAFLLLDRVFFDFYALIRFLATIPNNPRAIEPNRNSALGIGVAIGG